MILYNVDSDAREIDKEINSYYNFSDYTTVHDHDYWEFFAVLQGSYKHTLNDVSSVINENTAFLLRPETDKHCLTNNEKPSSHFTIRIRKSIMQRCCGMLSPEIYTRLMKETPSSISLDKAQRNYILSLSSILNNEQNKSERRNLLTNLIVLNIIQTVITQSNLIMDDKPKWLAELLVTLNLSENIGWTVEDIVANSNFSHTHLLRMFKQYMGMTLREYLTKLKMEKARNMLMHSKMSINQISEVLGYSDSPHFTRTFKRLYNMSPIQFRQSTSRTHNN